MEPSLITSMSHFSLYFSGALLSLILFKYVYAFITPHDEWKLLNKDSNTAAAIGFGGAIIGFSIALGGVITHSISYFDFLTWAGVAVIAQAIAFGLVRFLFLNALIQRIESNDISAGLFLASVNIAVGILNAACMSY